MLRRILTALTLAMAITNGAMARAQETPPPPATTPPPAQTPQAPKAKIAPAQPVPLTPRVAPPARTPQPYIPRAGEESEAQAGPLTMKIARNARIAVSSRMVNVRITGVDGDTLEATATSDEGAHLVKAQTSGDEANPKILIYVPLTPGRHTDRDVNLIIRLPRYATIEAIESLTGDIDVSGIDAPVVVNTNNGQITVARVASLKASTRHGE